MARNRSFNILGLSLAMLVIQFATLAYADSTESAKTVEIVDPTPVSPPSGMYPHALMSLTSDTGAFPHYAFLMDKKSRTLSVWQTANEALKLIGAWPADFGRGRGDKSVAGDYKTPEGVYFFQTSMDGHKVDYDLYGNHIFTLDYPNYFDRLDGKTGQGIWLHAIPETTSLLRGSRGCVVVRNKVIAELGKFIDLKKTPIVIVDEVNYLSEGDWRAIRKQFIDWLESWRKTWSNKDINKYMAQYSERFKSGKMNKTQWRAYKDQLSQKYKFIDINLTDVQIFNQGPKVVFRFLQHYKSDQKEDFGAKTLYMLKNGAHGSSPYEIVGETWEAL